MVAGNCYRCGKALEVMPPREDYFDAACVAQSKNNPLYKFPAKYGMGRYTYKDAKLTQYGAICTECVRSRRGFIYTEITQHRRKRERFGGHVEQYK